MNLFTVCFSNVQIFIHILTDTAPICDAIRFSRVNTYAVNDRIVYDYVLAEYQCYVAAGFTIDMDELTENCS